MSPQGERYLPWTPPRLKDLALSSLPHPARHSACVGRHSPLLTRSPRSHLVPRCRLRRLPPVLLSLSRYSLERSPGGTSSGLRPDSPVYLRTAIVPDEPIRAKGTEWGISPPPCTFVAAQPPPHPSPCRTLLGLPSLLALTRLATASFLGLRLRRFCLGAL